ncbi:hypothetical protein Q1695_009499 [Nippostrongylus brasiliensis]|nr:hypothetical protein Q1695_009499 [Nippostrongylus brasiliensis]
MAEVKRVLKAMLHVTSTDSFSRDDHEEDSRTEGFLMVMDLSSGSSGAEVFSAWNGHLHDRAPIATKYAGMLCNGS